MAADRLTGPEAPVTRTYFIDRLRVVLTALVILHHTAITYGGSGGWFYREIKDGSTPTSLLLTIFCAVNQSYFMGFFFLLAGYFTPSALRRKGPKSYLRERLIRLGIPLLAFGFFLGPLTVALASLSTADPIGERLALLLSAGSFVIGPLWFAWALLLFALGFVAWRSIRPQPNIDAERPIPPNRHWLYAALGVGVAALIIRQFVPVGENRLGLQLGYFASYVFLFALGCQASSYRWLERVGRTQASHWRKVTLITLPLLLISAAFSGALSGKVVNFNGGLGLPAIVYAFWEPFVAWGVIASLLVLFRERFNVPSPCWQAWGASAYGAYIVHAPILVGVSRLLADWAASPLIKFALVGTVSVVTSFAVGWMLLRLPGVRRVL